MTKAIIFDFWGTIVETGVFPSPVRQVKRIMRLDVPFSEFIVKFEKVLMTRRFDSLSEAFEHVAQEFGVNPPPFVYDKLIGMWNKNRLLAKPFEETMEVLERLHEKYKLVLLSNSDSLSIEPLLERFDLRRHFDIIKISCETGVLKTDPQAFEDILAELGADASDVVMVGDSLESDMVPAKAAGMRAILVDRRDRREYPDKISDLTQLDSCIG